MAELLRTQGYRVQVSGVPSAATPQVSFGQQPRPEVEFQARANYQQTLAQVVDRISETAFGIAKKFGEEAGQQYVIQNPVTDQQIKDMAAGRIDPNLVSWSPLNVFSAAVRKSRAIEVSGHILAEGRKIANDLMIQAEDGTVNTETATSKLSAFMESAGTSLAQIDPDASLRFRANMATIGSAVVDKVAQIDLMRRQSVNRAKLDFAYNHVLTTMNNFITRDVVDPNIYQILAGLEEAFYNEASVMVSLEAANGYRSEFRKDIERLKLNLVAGYVTNAENPIAAFDELRKGKTKNQFINSLVSPTSTNRMAMLDAARKELTAFNTLEDQRVSERERQGVAFEAQFADALAANDRISMNNALDNLRYLSPSKYASLKKVASEGGGVFAFTDNANVVADLERKLNNPFGPKVSVNEVFSLRGQLTQSSFSRYVNAAKTMEDQQIEIMLEYAASQIGMQRGGLVMPGVERARQEKIISDLKIRFIDARRLNPNLSPLEFLDANLDKTRRTATASSDNEVFTKIQSFTYRSRQAFDKAIRDAELNKQTDQANMLKEQRTYFLDAVKNGVIDGNGNRINKQ